MPNSYSWLSTYSVPSTVLGAMAPRENKTDGSPALMELNATFIYNLYRKLPGRDYDFQAQ